MNLKSTFKIALATVVAGGIGYVLLPAGSSPVSPCGSEYERAALRELPWVQGVPGYFCRNAYVCSDKNLARYARQAQELRLWADTLSDRCVRNAYAGWADYVDRRVSRARKEAATERRRAALDLPAPPAR